MINDNEMNELSPEEMLEDLMNNPKISTNEIITIMTDNKGENITIFSDLKNYFTQTVVICNCMSDRHCSKVAEEIVKYLKDNNVKLQTSLQSDQKRDDWIVVDIGHSMFHFIIPSKREHFRLDQLLLEISRGDFTREANSLEDLAE